MHLLRVINELVKTRAVTIYLTRTGGEYEKFLDQRIRVIHLTNINRSSLLALLVALLQLKKIIKREQLDHMISIMDMQNIGLLKLNIGTPNFKKILICQVSPLSQYKNGFFNKYLLGQVRNQYKKSDHIIALSKGVAREIKELAQARDNKISIIHNAGFDQKLFNKTFSVKHRVEASGIDMVACGRLSEQKGFDILIEALSLLPKSSDWHLRILGKGPDEDALKEQASRLGVGAKVEFMGFVDNPYPFFEQSDLFVLSSRWEGFGNVIVEAMITGTAVLSAQCPHGPDEIISHGQSGWLVAPNDPKAIAEGLKTLMSDDKLRNKIALAGRTRAKDFAPELIAKKYDEALQRCVGY